MKKKKFLLPFFLLAVMLLQMPIMSNASDSVTALIVTEIPSDTEKIGLVTKDGNTYYYKNDKKQKGFQKIGEDTYFFNTKGIMLFGFQKIGKSTYYFDSEGKMAVGFKEIKGKTYYFNKKGKRMTGFRSIKRKKYYFTSKGVMVTGFRTIKKKTYYFDENGIMQKGLVQIGKKHYYFDDEGIMQKGFCTIDKNKYYFNSKGVMVTGLKKINKKYYYFDDEGVMQTGFTDIKSVTYYFDPTTGVKYMPKKDGTIKKIDNTYASFNKDGSYQITASYVLVKGVKMQVQYYTDPKVSDEKLLAAILYAEAGNQKNAPVKGKLNNKTKTFYKGHLSVGYVILNRITPSLGLKEVIYQQYQFEPARTGVLTQYLENYDLVSTDCKNTAKLLLSDYKNETDSVPDFKRSDFTWNNFWAVTYAQKTNFFSVYSESEYYVLQGHVFFNFTKKIS